MQRATACNIRQTLGPKGGRGGKNDDDENDDDDVQKLMKFKK